ncbi:hypothetical protein MC885_005129 [Smutsia gigantea]|nr:hypothetical protein MC885_005129 [Smutsia gigantea]
MKWPCQVSVHYGGFHICGGSIIDEYGILSAAHCFGSWGLLEVGERAGPRAQLYPLQLLGMRGYGLLRAICPLRQVWSHIVRGEEGETKSHGERDRSPELFDLYGHRQSHPVVNKVILHPTYGLYHPVGGDIALVQLKTRIVFSDSVLPICIAPPDVNLQNLTCWATGWGFISQQGRSSDKLQEVQLPLIPVALCQLHYGHTSYIQPDMLCAGNLRNVKTVCEGDSGGPVVCEFNHIWLQIGVVSWSRGGAYPMYPAVYARVYFSQRISHHVEHPPPHLLSPSLPIPPV